MKNKIHLRDKKPKNLESLDFYKDYIFAVCGKSKSPDDIKIFTTFLFEVTCEQCVRALFAQNRIDISWKK